jgi:hydrogenase maturation protease
MREDRWRREAAEAIAAARRIAVLGIGNSGKGDDGAGLAAAAALKKKLSPSQRRRVRVLIGGPAPENLTGKIRALRPGLVVVLDAALGGRAPGSIFRVEPGKIADDGVTTHQISLRLLVRYIEESIDCPVLVLGIEPKSMGEGEKLSAAAEKGISSAVGFLVENLVRPGRRPPPA